MKTSSMAYDKRPFRGALPGLILYGIYRMRSLPSSEKENHVFFDPLYPNCHRLGVDSER
jgi:hypothetical protein